jgi:glutamyl-tRNA synthetase
LDEQLRRIQAGKSFTIRFRANPKANKILVTDIARGKLELPAFTNDAVLLKSDGIPTYHFAHVIDDHLMRTTIVIRGDEWLATLPLHIALFAACGFKPPKYAHTAPVMKEDNGGKRKISKRKDPEAAVSYFIEAGFPAAGVTEYLLTLLNSNFEDWRRANQDAPTTDFPFNLKKLSPSGALFDLAKLDDVCKNVVARMPAQTVLDAVLIWAKQYDPELEACLSADPAYALAMFAIGRGGKKPRKDFARWGQVKDQFAPFFDTLYSPAKLETPDAHAIVQAFLENADNLPIDSFARIRSVCEPLGYSADMIAYKANPTAYKGSITDVSTVIRLAITGRENSPDLGAVMRVLGESRVLARLRAFSL